MTYPPARECSAGPGCAQGWGACSGVAPRWEDQTARQGIVEVARRMTAGCDDDPENLDR